MFENAAKDGSESEASRGRIATKVPKRLGSQNYSEGEKQCLLGFVRSTIPLEKKRGKLWQ
ncbi:hypothetical protein JG687_00014856 [Phytophthora cactorum]|uniref:Uncharacterized protein n=1 Tax=Phytophthora cactorum TaxID=29920 RepID=A0A329RGH3_9STRA|nr:hypothetical protein PC112_g11912 [Phytophthora cactorum]KAG2887914.1 hypothetical protein PC115_g20198 [Phytophthora cactorum]KAG2916157.1 hypothetical protein PC117_g17821 [Phytophthora cactorum]KAG2994978.1 hypothetical protein PC120_g21860 [Phytophthora cactorum]KAG3132307.1 hypothetical protein C6341_g22973 [Phytophthora cactorum]